MQFIECCPAREKQHGRMDTGWFQVCLLLTFVISWLTSVAATDEHHRRGCITHLQIRKRSKFKIQSTVSTKGILLLHPCKAEKWWAEPGWVGVCLCITKCQSRGRPASSSGEAGWGATEGPELTLGGPAQLTSGGAPPSGPKNSPSKSRGETAPSFYEIAEARLLGS